MESSDPVKSSAHKAKLVPGELEHVIKLANSILDRPNADPDDDLAALSRQLLRALEAKEREPIVQWTLTQFNQMQSEIRRNAYTVAMLSLMDYTEHAFAGRDYKDVLFDDLSGHQLNRLKAWLEQIRLTGENVREARDMIKKLRGHSGS